MQAIKFNIYRSVKGIGSSRYPDGILETKKPAEIAMLRRLSPDHAKEIIEAKPVEEWEWHELMDYGVRREVYKVGMNRHEAEVAIRRYQEEYNEFTTERVGA